MEGCRSLALGKWVWRPWVFAKVMFFSCIESAMLGRICLLVTGLYIGQLFPRTMNVGGH